MESHQLTPGSTLALFKQMGEAVAEANRPLAARKACPRCQALLTRELDKQRSTTFEAFRCPAGHGRYMTFGAFLRAKNFVRDLTPAEIAELRRHVQSVKCTGCGAAVDVREHSACTFCRAPIAMIDPDQLQRTIAALQEKEALRPKPLPGKGAPGVDPALPLRLALSGCAASASSPTSPAITSPMAPGTSSPGIWSRLACRRSASSSSRSIPPDAACCRRSPCAAARSSGSTPARRSACAG